MRHHFGGQTNGNPFGVVLGPVLGGLLLLVSWTALYAGVSVLTAGVFS